MTDKESGQEVLLEKTKMSDEQRQTMEVAEAAREKKYAKPSFSRKLFMGNFDAKMVTPFPKQSEEDRKIGDELVAKTIEFLKANVDPNEIDAKGDVPKEVIEGLKNLGLFKMKVPKEYGGLGLSQVNYNRVMMTVSSYCGSTAVLLSAHQSIGVPMPLKLFGSEEQKKKYYPKLAEGAITAFALTEPDVGSDPARMIAEAHLSEDGKHYILNGAKLWISNGPIADLMVVMAKTAPKMVHGKEKKQISAFIVDMKAPGVEVVHRCEFMGLRGVQNGLISFVDVKVPVEDRLSEEGRGLAIALTTLNTGRLTLPAACAGMGKECLAIARDWGMARVQWGKPVGLHEMGREKVAYIASTTLALEAITALTSRWVDEGDTDIRIEAAMAKLFCTEAGWDVVDTTLQFCGGRGYETVRSLKGRGDKHIYPVERMMRDSRVNKIIEGTSEIMHLFIAREALDPHLGRVASILGRGMSPLQRLGAALKAAGFYALWYPARWFKSLLVRPYRKMGKLAPHMRFVDRASHKLARTLFHKMVVNGPALEKRELTLARLVDIGTELFAMTATCSYAKSLFDETGDKTPIALANHFCLLSQERISQKFTELGLKPEKRANPLAKELFDGKMTWLEEGIIR